MVDNSHRLLAMVNDLLDLSRAEAGRAEVNLGPVDLDEFVSGVVGNLAPLASSMNLSLGFRRNGKLPQVYTDEQKLGQILVNLLSNAIKFTEQGSVLVSVKTDGKSFSISVKDTGIGIAADETEAVFSEFYQVQGRKNGERGSGLGLTISQKLAGLLGGKITVKSKLGRGSTFTVTLPLVRMRSPRGIQQLTRGPVSPARTKAPGTEPEGRFGKPLHETNPCVRVVSGNPFPETRLKSTRSRTAG